MTPEQTIVDALKETFEMVYIRAEDPLRVGIEFPDGTFVQIDLTRIFTPGVDV